MSFLLDKIEIARLLNSSKFRFPTEFKTALNQLDFLFFEPDNGISLVNGDFELPDYDIAESYAMNQEQIKVLNGKLEELGTMMGLSAIDKFKGLYEEQIEMLSAPYMDVPPSYYFNVSDMSLEQIEYIKENPTSSFPNPVSASSKINFVNSNSSRVTVALAWVTVSGWLKVLEYQYNELDLSEELKYNIQSWFPVYQDILKRLESYDV